ncbi:MFS transporter [Roseibium marinum]|uniref:Putative MFS family arabinose efflux permease n=1 Tax=Roseibium marinum TaxID=281252 RepID=A0A2S3V3F9_9HYPH|nr:putative MFS family arabinose efflux permease [Roseibium marinum]
MTSNNSPIGGSRFAIFRYPGFRRYWIAIVLIGFALQIQTVAVGWQVYEMTRSAFNLGLVGLSQFLPALGLVLVTGAVADRLPRKRILITCLLVEAVCAAGLMVMTLPGFESILPIFGLLMIFGAARAFYNPARQAIVPNLVPENQLPNAIAVNTTANQFATICGPVAGGLLYGVQPGAAYGATLGLLLAAAVLVFSIPNPEQQRARGHTTWATISAGFSYILSEKVVLGAISLDLFAVLLGGAVALLPIYAHDILHVGPSGLGFLRSAQAVGAISMGALLIWRPVSNHAGRIMFAAVFAFGLFTLVFAVSETLWISVFALALMGGADMVSVYIRGTLIQLWTPDELRGRVNAVNQVFIGASNELGGFRAGTTTALIGPVAAVLAGGIGTLAVAGLWMRGFPQLRHVKHLTRS